MDAERAAVGTVNGFAVGVHRESLCQGKPDLTEESEEETHEEHGNLDAVNAVVHGKLLPGLLRFQCRMVAIVL